MAKAVVLTALVSLLCSVAQATPDPPNFSSTGKFFYTQVYYDPEDTQQYYVNMQLGCGNFSQKWLITTQEESMGYVTTICDTDLKCDVPNKFPWAEQTSNPAKDCIPQDELGQDQIQEHARLNGGPNQAFENPIPDFVLQGYSATNRLIFQYPEYGRENVIDLKAFAIMQSNNFVFQSAKFSGFLGFGPYSSNSIINEESILYSLKARGYVDHAIVSLYLQKGQSSSIKFGSYDRAAIQNFSEFETFKTINREDWRVIASDPLINGNNFQTKTELPIEFQVDPQLGLIYIPSDDYTIFVQHVIDLYGADDVNCVDFNGLCHFPTTCDKIPDANLPFEILIKDDLTKKNIEISKDSLLVDGIFIQQPGKCFIAVYKLPWPSTEHNVYYFGAPFFHDYYVTFSMESYYNSRTDYLEMGIGPICKTANLGDIAYNKKYKYYNNQSIESDKSTEIPGAQVIFANDLDNTCIPPPPVDPIDDGPSDVNNNPTQDKGSDKTMFIVAIIAGSVAFLITIVIIVMYCYIKKSKQTNVQGGDEEKLLSFGVPKNAAIQNDDSMASSKGRPTVGGAQDSFQPDESIDN